MFTGTDGAGTTVDFVTHPTPCTKASQSIYLTGHSGPSKLWHKLLAVSHKSPPNFTLFISPLKALFTFNVKCSLTLQIWTSKCNIFGLEHFMHNFAGCGPRRVASFLGQHNLKQAKTSSHMKTFSNFHL